jgi:Protein of unknown function (DUF2442)
VDDFAARRADAELGRRRAPKVVWNASPVLRMKMIDVIGVKRLGGHVLEIAFSDGTVGARDFAEIRARTGEMVAPLKDVDYFARVFIEDGALTWPNGYDWDPMALHDDMKNAGLLHRVDAAE